MLNRAQGQGFHEGDPRYFRNSSTLEQGMYDPVLGASAVCWNVLNHLDNGVLSEQYGGLLPKVNDTPTILSHLYPITVVELGEGFVIGTEKILTKASGIFRRTDGLLTSSTRKKKHGAPVVLLFQDCFLKAAVLANTSTTPTRGVEFSRGDTQVAIDLQPNHQALVLW